MAWTDPVAATDANISAAPAELGVYALYQGTLIYIGRAWGTGVTIRSRLQAHKRGDEGACTKAMTAFSYMVTSNPQQAETNALNGYKRDNNQNLPRCNERVG